MTTARRSALAALSALTLIISLPGTPALPAGVQKSNEPAPRYGGTLRIKAFLTPFNQVFDPAVPSHYFICEQLYDGLIRFDAHFNPVPALAEYWKVSDGGARITFFLRRGVRFHNGRELTAEDVKFSLERLVQKRPGSAYDPYFTRNVVGAADYVEGRAPEVSGFRVVDSYTFEIQWTRPYASGLYLLGMYYCKVLPRDLAAGSARSFFQKPIGTGPFRFAEWIRSPRLDILGVVLERNPDYFGKKPYLSRIEYSPHFTEEQFEEGSVHVIPVTSDRWSRRGFPILENATLRTAFLAMSCDLPPLDKPEVRKAILLGLDKARLAEAYDTPAALHQALDNYIPPFLPGFFPRSAKPFTDPAAAALLLDRLLPAESRKDLTLTLALPPPRTDPAARLARELARQLEAMSVRLEVKTLRRPEDARDLRTPFLTFLEHELDFPDAENIIGPLFHSRSALNGLSVRYRNPRVDALLDQSGAEASWERRVGLFRDVEKVLFEDVPAIPLFTERIRIVVQPRVRGISLPALGFVFLDAKEIWLGE